MAEPQPQDDSTDKEDFVDELKPGTKLMHGQYTIESFLNAGGFGITYLAKDSLDRKVVIKECFPGAFCRRSRYIVQARSRAHQNELKSIVRLFVQEARSLAKLDHPNIVGVHQVFEDNDTAYMALDFVTGRDLLDTIDDPNHGLTPTQIKSILKEILGAVGFIHDQGILHRDISPDNILIDDNFNPVLIDFGAAREEATKQSRVLSALRVVKDGYSPQEFYISGSEQSPSSDLYALSASFYHLIDGDTPPNSQARLAAIASGDADPYKPLAGRNSDYDQPFLEALDKALAVLPKDRVQSAAEWLEMMEGGTSNVTPLKVANASSDTNVQAASDDEAPKKSKMPLLLGSAAVVALLVGFGVTTMSGDEEPASGSQTPFVADAPVIPPAPVAAPAAPSEPVVVEAPEVIAPAPAAPVVADAPAVETAAEETLVDEAALEATAAEETPAVVEEPVTQQAAIDPPAAEDILTADIRPSVRPETIETAPLPEPVATPELAADQPVADDALPTALANRPVDTSEVAPVDLPTTPDNVANVGAGPDVEIAAITPGNELPPARAAVTGDWTVQLPFKATAPQSNVVAEAGPISPMWVEPGLVIVAVNGTNIDAISDIPAILRAQVAEGDVAPTIPVSFNTIQPETGNFVQYNWVVPVVQNVTLADGTAFQTIFSGTVWSTSVVALSQDGSGALQVGDMLTSYISTGESIDQRTSLLDLFEREFASGTEQFSFAVQRDGGLWVASMTASGLSE